MNILLLGGTSDARVFANRAHAEGLFGPQTSGKLIYSVAGLVRQPNVPCEVISGGFTQFGGFGSYLDQFNIDAVLDMTHPYAAKMSATAVQVCREMDLPYWRFLRSPWCAQAGDQWTHVSCWSEVVEHCASFRRILLTVGQLSQNELDQLVSAVSSHVATTSESQNSYPIILRTAATPRVELPEQVKWVKAIGPFQLDDERALLQQHKIDVLVSKNSGGEAIRAKLDAARGLNIPVVMVDRPATPAATTPAEITPGLSTQFNSIDECLANVKNALEKSVASTVE